MRFIFGRVPRCARVGLLRTTLTLRCYAIAPHCLTACSVSLTQAVFGCFTLFLYIFLLYLVGY
ncbi:MAG: hypothetical protein NZ455_10990 [Bacteroidia bacterium]|nr:hypothetical protein [Bacteroidia bacterium]MDW8347010.1 hypothetical protein [Bacteroidia bacterium]